MSDWTNGYITEIGYTYGYYQELSPVRMQWALLNLGYEPPQPTDGGYKVCELGFGQGMSLNIHAAAQPGQWYGTDFNPAQTAFAQKLALASSASLKLFDDSFVEFSERPDLPQFDIIALHGIWSWVSDENRRSIVEFIRKQLKVGGVVYCSYNTLPGWANGMPLRRLMIDHANSMAARGEGMVQRIDAALSFAQRLFDTNPATVRANPQLTERLERVKGQSRNYLAHEYFNRDWKPMYFSEMAEWLEPAKLSFAASAHLIDHLPALNLLAEQRKLLEEIADPVLHETLRDFCTNQQFRKDLWVRGAQRLNAVEVAAAMRSMRVLLVHNAKQVSLKVNGPLGEVQMNTQLYQPVLDAMAGHQVISIRDLEKKISSAGMHWWQLREVLTMLMGSGAVALAQPQRHEKAQKPVTEKLNAEIIRLSHTRRDLGFLASPVSGGGVNVSRFDQLFLAALAAGKKSPKEWAEHSWAVLSGNGESLLKEGKPLEGAQANIDELHLQAQVFSDMRLPIFRALGILA
jgi:SAM-dependent methyltransferase